jgi:hypothetical protein
MIALGCIVEITITRAELIRASWMPFFKLLSFQHANASDLFEPAPILPAGAK